MVKIRFDDRSEYISHYGVAGMKWGVRNERELKGRQYGRKQILSSVRDKASTAIIKRRLGSAMKSKIFKKPSSKAMSRIKNFLGLAGMVAASVAINAFIIKRGNARIKDMADAMIDNILNTYDTETLKKIFNERPRI